MTLRILANENFPRVLVAALRSDGHDVVWVWETSRGSTDAEVLQRAQVERRIVATFDKDFGELAFRARLPATCGVLLLRLVGPPQSQLRLLRRALEERADWRGVFVTVSNDSIRVRPIPPAGE